MSLKHDRELADTLEGEAQRRRRTPKGARYAESLEREAMALRARAMSVELLRRAAHRRKP